MGDVICQNIQTKAIEILLNKLNINFSEQLLRAASMDVDSIWTGLTLQREVGDNVFLVGFG